MSQRKYQLVVIKNGKTIVIDEKPNHSSQRINEMEWDGHVFDMSDLYKRKN